uniref:Uncharacterized protein n=1 Tax=Arion vulgaris TaxID=1028688 RepID=A0A0B7ASA4_9EUPU
MYQLFDDHGFKKEIGAHGYSPKCSDDGPINQISGVFFNFFINWQRMCSDNDTVLQT